MLFTGLSGYVYRFHPPSAQSDLSDIPPLQRVIIAVAVVIQAGLLIILLTRQADELLLLRVLFIQQVAPFIVFCAPFCSPFRTDKRQRQAAMVAVVQVDFRAGVYTGSIWFCICSTVRPHDASQRRLSSLTRSARFHFPAGRASAPAPAGTPHCHRLRRRTAEAHPPGLRRCVFASSPVAVSTLMSGVKPWQDYESPLPARTDAR